MADQSLKDKTVKGTFWSAADSILRYGVAFVVGVVLARLLSPDEYGLIGILAVFIAIFEIIIDGGLINALIRKTDAQEIDYCTVFYTNMVLSIAMALIIFFSASIIADFFERQELVPLTQVMSCVVILHALALVPKARLTKLIDFKTQTEVSFIAAVISGVFGIVMAYMGYGVWALVGQQISNAVVSAILFWIMNKWLPKFQFSMSSFKEMWSFGWKLLLSGIFNTVSTQLNQVVIGKCFSPATLGQFTRAQQFGSIFSGNLTTVIQRVTFPVLSEIQNDPEHLKAAYKRVIKVTVFPTFILMMCLAACAKPLLMVLIGEKWIEASYLLQILCFSMMLFPLHALNLNAIQVMGRSDLTLKVNIIKNLLMIFPIVVGILTNIYWMLLASTIREFYCYYLNAYYTKTVLNYSVWEQIRDITPSIKVSCFVALPVYLLSFLPFNFYLLLVFQVIASALLIGFICEKTKYPEYVELKGIMIQLIRR